MNEKIANAKVQYPRIWEYLIITSAKETLQSSIKDRFDGLKYDFAFSKDSSGGKYASYNFSIYVLSQKERDEIFDILTRIEGVRAVI